MAEKSGDSPKVYITSKGAVYVDANELFSSPKRNWKAILNS